MKVSTGLLGLCDGHGFASDPAELRARAFHNQSRLGGNLTSGKSV